ncbi:S-locus glycoprotein domain [Sesbania bispinosa]|nr:S-locus glycoprotein domain [Sesbania bispinosa]
MKLKSMLRFSFIFLLFISISALTFSDHINPNFSASYLQFISDTGTFLLSSNKTFKAAIFNPSGQQTSFYLCVIHVASSTIIWSANRDAPISDSGKMNLTSKGITIFDEDGNIKWSTPPLKSPVNKLSLTEMGNLVLLDKSNNSLWESFQHPTDTIVIGQRLPVGASLSSAASNSNLSTGSYNFTITSSDAILQWYGQTYWKLSMDTKVYKNSNNMVKYMAINSTGFYFIGHDDIVSVYQVGLPLANFRIAKLASSGQFTLSSFSGTNWKQEFVVPDDGCQTPFVCGRAGLCSHNTVSSSAICSCPPNFHVGSGNFGGCVPSDGSYSLPLACPSTDYGNQSNSSVVSFLKIGNGVQYFSNIYSDPVMYGVNLSACQDFCSDNCSCLGIFYKNSSGSCFMIANGLGSIQSSNAGGSDLLGFIKAIAASKTTSDDTNDGQTSQNEGFPVAAAVLLPIAGSHSMEDSNSGGGGNSSNSSTSGLVYFPLFALEMHEQGSYLELADPRLEGRVTNDEVEKLVRIALCCVHEEPALRPNMVTVVGMLEGGTPLPQPRMESLNFLRFYGRRFTEASMIAEENEFGSLMHQQARNSTTLTGGSQNGFSYISSQNISGPR